MKKVLVFGACGFVGHYLIDEFSKHDYLVFGSDTRAEANDLQCPYFQGDITDYSSVHSIIEKVNPDYLVNLAAISSVAFSWENPQVTFSVNVIGILNILGSLIDLNLFRSKTLVVGSSEEYLPKNSPLSITDPLNSNNPYGISKTTQEQLAELYSKKYGLSVIRVRSFNHTGVGQADTFVIPSFCKQVAEIEKSKKPGVISVGNLSAVRDFSDVRDIVACYRWLLENKESGVFNVGSGEALSLEEILKKIISMSSQKIDVVVDPNKIRPVDTPYICCSKSEDSYKFVHNFADTLKELYEFYLYK